MLDAEGVVPIALYCKEDRADRDLPGHPARHRLRQFAHQGCRLRLERGADRRHAGRLSVPVRAHSDTAGPRDRAVPAVCGPRGRAELLPGLQAAWQAVHHQRAGADRGLRRQHRRDNEARRRAHRGGPRPVRGRFHLQPGSGQRDAVQPGGGGHLRLRRRLSVRPARRHPVHQYRREAAAWPNGSRGAIAIADAHGRSQAAERGAGRQAHSGYRPVPGARGRGLGDPARFEHAHRERQHGAAGRRYPAPGGPAGERRRRGRHHR